MSGAAVQLRNAASLRIHGGGKVRTRHKYASGRRIEGAVIESAVRNFDALQDVIVGGSRECSGGKQQCGHEREAVALHGEIPLLCSPVCPYSAYVRITG